MEGPLFDNQAELQDLLFKLQTAERRDKIFNIDTRKFQSLEDAVNYANEGKGSRYINPGIRIVGDRKTLNRLIYELNLLKTFSGSLGTFAKLKNESLRQILNMLNPDDIIALCSSSKSFLDKCRKVRIYHDLTMKFFPNAAPLSEDEATNFTLLWNSRLRIDDFQAANDTSFENHQVDIDQIITSVETYIDKIRNSGLPANILSPLSAVDAIYLMQFPRRNIFEKFDQSKSIIALLSNVDDSDKVEQTLTELYDEGIEFTLPYVDIGISHQEYLDILQPLTPDANLPREEWIKEMNMNIQNALRDIIEAGDDPTILLQLFSLEMKDPWIFWIFYPLTGELIDQIKEVWQKMLDFRATYMSEDDLQTRRDNWQEVQDNVAETGTNSWYNPDFDLVLEDEEVQELIEQGLLNEENLFEDDNIVCDPTRWDTIWEDKLKE